jgi:hypothetical protein
VLLYETNDTRFANRAIEALRRADIPCYRVGSGSGDGSPMNLMMALGESRICIHVERDSDYRRANDILIALGAAREEPLRLPSARGVRIVIILVVALAVCIALVWSR